MENLIQWPRVVVLAIGAGVVVVGALMKLPDLIPMGTAIIGYAMPSGWLDRRKIQQDGQK